MMRAALCVALSGLLWAGAAAAEQGLMGRSVVFSVETWDDPAAPFLQSSAYRAVVGPGPEFGLAPETNGDLYVVPVLIDIGDDRIDISFKNIPPGTFYEAAFNGYILTFETDCVLFESAILDIKATTLPIGKDAVEVTPQAVRVNVSGLGHDQDSTIGVRLDVQDCPLS
ncbi:hypothetical protein [Flavimaricola marinus]|uniref:Uncharacterized protein n=1 Tax=Flavimaricola marinus TaxID=1819565 RepID=A0A238LAU5_9RHOB|nr:hypothetical protein [Flavimaricola marinus]SMY06799.1 hypothetical protein LOM8899_00929 [Flavimaricola marinus]